MPTTTTMTDAELVQRVMELRGWSQRDLAEVLDISQGLVSQLKNNLADLRMAERLELNRLIARHYGAEDFAATRYACDTWNRFAEDGVERDVDAVLDHVETCPRCISKIVLLAQGWIAVGG